MDTVLVGWLLLAAWAPSEMMLRALWAPSEMQGSYRLASVLVESSSVVIIQEESHCRLDTILLEKLDPGGKPLSA
jgi:hypothetical protein